MPKHIRQVMDSDVLTTHLKQAFMLVVEHGPVTGGEARALAGKQNMNNRLAELASYGVIKRSGMRRCNASGRRAYEYTVTGNLPSEPARSKTVVPSPRECKDAAEYFQRNYLIASAHGGRPPSAATRKVATWLRQGAPTPNANGK